MKKIIFIFLLITQSFYAQERVSSDEIYILDGITYSKSNDKVFNGVVQWTKKKGKHITYEMIVEQGRIIKSINYFNISDRQIISEEIIYNKDTFLKEKKVKYNLEGDLIWVTYYDENENKKLYENYENEQLIYSCEYLNKKKHGKEFCVDKKGKEETHFYEKGKQINKKI